MYVQQVSVFMENKVGKIGEITAVLDAAGVDIRAFCISDTAEFGILRLIVSEPERAAERLRASGLTAQLSDVIVVSIDDRIGALDKIVQTLRGKNINIQYMYSFMSEKKSCGHVALYSNDMRGAEEALKQAGIETEAL